MSRTKQGRSREQRDFIYGINPVLETMRGKRKHSALFVRSERQEEKRVSELIELAKSLRIPVHPVNQQRLDSLCDGGNHQGLVLETGPFQYVEIDTLLGQANGRPILMLDHLKDPQNLATLIRTAAAIDIAGIVIQSDRSAQVTPAVVRSSAGLVEQMTVAREKNTRQAIDYVKKNGYWAVAVESTEDAQDLFQADIPTPVALVIGSEERGVSQNVLKACDLTVFIPMPGRVESLNAAVAGSVALFELYRQTAY
jgi:23S rRNA (guanosine2251-2'-O)-methyltransferase